MQLSTIDTWRGISVLLVVAHHVAIRLPLTKSTVAGWLPERLLLALNWNGYEAVLVFFVISGFLITTRTLDRDGTPAEVDVRAFWARRFARIAPPLVLLVAALSVLHLAGAERYAIDPSRQSLGGAVLSALGFWLNVYEARTGYLPGGWDVLWSLSIEEVFYLAFPLLFVAARREGVPTGTAGTTRRSGGTRTTCPGWPRSRSGSSRRWSLGGSRGPPAAIGRWSSSGARSWSRCSAGATSGGTSSAKARCWSTPSARPRWSWAPAGTRRRRRSPRRCGRSGG
jgi:hypothetical protein